MLDPKESLKTSFRRADRARLSALRRSGSFSAPYDESEPLVSVYIPTLERTELLLERALPSVFRQDYENWEVVIVGDGMDELRAARLRGINSRRVRFVNLNRRGRYPTDPVGYWYTAGMKPANFARRVLKGRWVTPLDDDDEFSPTHISTLLNLARECRVEWVYGKVMMREETGNKHVILGQPEPELGRIAHVSSLYHASLKEFRYNPRCWEYGFPADWDLWDRFLEMGVTHAFLDEIVSVSYCRPAVFQAIVQAASDGYD